MTKFQFKFMSKYQSQAYALLRIVAGFMFCLHGAQKLMGFLGGPQASMGSLMWLAGLIELLGGILIMLGLYTSIAAFIASGEMAVAYFMVHWKFHFDDRFFPMKNQGELAALYCFVFLYLAAMGDGRWSLNKK
jgi:putative oxidoreductase